MKKKIKSTINLIKDFSKWLVLIWSTENLAGYVANKALFNDEREMKLYQMELKSLNNKYLK